ncbi:winged helix DNA-binding protein [Novosphingobium album (ex Hu et al. 2023)]|uniref:Winged helix DNA-binding protein n=1 Tax=Novosphingobium album (ex Hu et al. 2023) TaxID=2930093 RepID=A0ABT0B7R2_9SPHN|nr:winged helix DNA-binding protein [Novosphingobium album (ex Hu et al. 2023)]MCJ2180954.1 winged helix DNA-binding protein [Novosphingobium album (ex Hu et al. 2023)]
MSKTAGKGGAPEGEAIGQELTELEISITVLWNSVRRWISKRSNSNVLNGLSDLDVFLLHMLVYRNQSLRGSDLAFVLAIDDMHLVSYALKKLSKLEAVTSSKVGKEVFYEATDKGRAHYQEFRKDRERYLEPAVKFLADSSMDFATLNATLRALSGAYEQAARSAAAAKGD